MDPSEAESSFGEVWFGTLGIWMNLAVSAGCWLMLKLEIDLPV
jgi:hypothetical protein